MVQGAAMDVDDDDDPVPEITKRHFEEAMKFARRWNETLWLCSYYYGILSTSVPQVRVRQRHQEVRDVLPDPAAGQRIRQQLQVGN